MRTTSATGMMIMLQMGPGLILLKPPMIRALNNLYWGSSQSTSDYAWRLRFLSSGAGTSYDSRRYGFSVRCVAE